MCTVSFFPLSENNFVLTSNRDELPGRETLAPEIYKMEKMKIFFPKDMQAGGTWIGAACKRKMATLMNGGYVPHKRKEDTYKLSRGIILLKLLKAENSIDFLNNFNFKRIEPFTIVLFESQPKPILYEIVWDEKILHIERLPLKPKIWSSTPLYSREVHQLREKLFHNFIEKNALITAEKIWEFHHKAGADDENISLIMDRGFIHTKSITQLTFDSEAVTSRYHDLETDKEYELRKEFSI